MKIFVYALREFDEKAFYDRFSTELGVEYAYTTEHPSWENVQLAKGFEAISITPYEISAKLLEKFHEIGVRYIATRSIGYNHIDLEAAKAYGIGVSHVTYAPDTVADYTLMLMLMCCRNICHVLERAKLQDFSLPGKMGKNLSDCTVGIIGTGQIGHTVIKRLQGFGCKIYAYDLYPNAETAKLATYVSLEELYAKSDIVSLHTPATAENYHMIDDAALKQMKDGVILVNTARGTLVDEKALINHILAKKVGFAALDVLENEDGLCYINRMNDPIDNPTMAILGSLPNVILSPHTAFYTEQVVCDMAYKSIKGLLDMKNKVENPLIVL